MEKVLLHSANKIKLHERRSVCMAKKKKTLLEIIESKPTLAGIIIAVIPAIVILIRMPVEMKRIEDVINSQINTVNGRVDGTVEDIDEIITDVDTSNSQMTELSKQIATLSVTVESMHDMMSRMETRLNAYEKTIMDTAINIKLNNQVSASMKIEKVDQQNAFFLSGPVLTTVKYIGVDENSGQEYTADDLINQNIFFTYTEGNQEILFLGKYDKNGAWDDNCLINVYQDNQLISIMDAVYEHGKLISYTQIMADVNKEENVWIKSVKCPETEEVKNGETWIFDRSSNVEKDFSLADARNSDIISIFRFESETETWLQSYYCGNTSDGKYNDSTGDAYFVKYSESGTVLTLYKGNFSNGLFHDNTGKAWSISKDIDTDYMYTIGEFENGKAVNIEEKNFKNNLTLEQIEEIISEDERFKSLTWEVGQEV